MIGVPEGEDGKLLLPDDMTDKTIEWLHGVRAQDATSRGSSTTRPVRSCAAPGPTEWARQVQGQVRQGMGRLREQTFERQKKLGVDPAGRRADPRPDMFPAWDSSTTTTKKLSARQMEVYAGFQENADYNVGRVLDAVDEMGELDNTLIIYIWGDNGASMEGTTTGSFNEMTFLNGIVLDPEQQIDADRKYGGIEALGGPHGPALRGGVGLGRQHPVPVGQADGEPPRWDAQPDGRRLARQDQGERRVALPVHALHRHRPDDSRDRRHSRSRRRSTGSSRSRWTARASSTRSTTPSAESVTPFSTSRSTAAGDLQGRLVGLRAARPAPWDLSPETLAQFGPGSGWDPNRTTGSSTTCPDDFSQANNIAARATREARRAEGALLAGGGAQPRAAAARLDVRVLGQPAAAPDRDPVRVRGDVQNIQKGLVPRIAGRSYAIEAEIHVPDGGAEGVIVANADFIGGSALWVDEQGT